MNWNFFGFAFIQLNLNQYTGSLASCSRFFNTNILNNMGPRTEPCGIPRLTSDQLLQDEPTFVRFLLELRKSINNHRLVLSKPYAPSLTFSRSWDKHSYAFDRSMSIFPMNVEFCCSFCHACSNLKRACCVEWTLQSHSYLFR